ncbi:hypothetical protein HII31_05014 [Pseudocercospora fuligena]|uniref:Uncharacterized protein n=1 Tax=Pseudocercospora fuligena TaxID=685502 RepID=A0A8H6RM77_9PEZI|nr:hypothetical protein HII31_05014 [Pseudocercospora fuligena]
MPPPSSKKPTRGKRVHQIKIGEPMSSKFEVPGPSRDIFPFFDLSAELRNQIYELSLHHDRKNGITANVALLRVNKQACKEAQEYLFDHGSFYVEVDEEFVISQSEWETEYDCLTVKGDAAYKHDPARSIGSQLGCNHIWSNALRKLQHVHILLTEDGPKTTALFFTFATFLRSYQNEVKSVTLEIVDDSDVVDADVVGSILAGLPESISVQFLTTDKGMQQHLDSLRAE